MTKLCSVCHTDNKDEAQFCRSCGTSFAASAPASATPLATAADGTSDNVCGECGFQNKAGIRYCANCGMSLTAAASGFGDLASKGAPTPVEEADPYAGLSPPPISYTSFPPVAPYPPAPAAQADDETPLGNLLSPDIPDADAAIAARQSIATDHYAPPIESGFSSLEAVAPAPDRARMVVIGGAIALLVAGAAAWWFMGSSSSSSSSSSSTPAPAPVAAPSPVVVASAPAPILIIETARAPAPAAASTPAVEVAAPAREAPITPAPSATAATTGTLTPPPAAAAPLPQQADVAPMPVDAGANDAKKLATDKARREKAARDKADRDAKTKAVSDQRDQAAASARAEQEAQARRRAEEAQRTRVAPVAPAPLPAATEKAKGVREICAGRGTIAEAVCQSRQCASPEHANEAICRQIREADDRRRNYQN